MPTEPSTHFVFVDFENVQRVDLGLVEGRAIHVTLLIGKNQKKIDLALVQQIHRLGEQVKLVEVGASGPNALDMTLAYYLGRAVQRTPEAHFAVVSRDKDFMPMIGHMRDKDIKVDRYDSFAALPFLAQPKAALPPRAAAPVRAVPASRAAAPARKQPESRRDRIIARLQDPGKRNRPATQKALLARIKSDLGNEASDAGAEDILHELQDRRALTIDPKGRVRYL